MGIGLTRSEDSSELAVDSASGKEKASLNIPDGLCLPASAAGIALLLAAVFVFCSIRPLWYTDIWGHVSYGRVIWESGEIPSTEPLMPLSNGMRFIDPAWLSQVLAYLAFLGAGKAAISFLYAATITGSLGLIAHRVFDLTRSSLCTLLAFGLTVWIAWAHLSVVRPQNAGILLYCGLLSILLRRRWTASNWLVIPLIFAGWVNLHGSFAVGLGLLGCFTLGRAIDLLRRTKRLTSLVRDRRFKRLLVVTQMSVAATLLNPWGIDLLINVLAFGDNPNLQSIPEWRELSIATGQGKAAAIVSVLLVFVVRLTPRRITSSEWLTLLVLGAAALATSRMILWWAPAAACIFAIHLDSILRKRNGSTAFERDTVKSPIWTVCSAMVLLMAFEISHLGGVALLAATGKPTAKRIESVPMNAETPSAVARHLREHPPQGQIFNTYEWGDYLLWQGPPNLGVFLASHAHFVPEQVFSDYHSIVNANQNWETILGRYGVGTVVLDIKRRDRLIRLLEESPQWTLTYRDALAAVFVRNSPA